MPLNPQDAGDGRSTAKAPPRPGRGAAKDATADYHGSGGATHDMQDATGGRQAGWRFSIRGTGAKCLLLLGVLAFGAGLWWVWPVPESKPVQPLRVARGEMEPAEWGKVWPLQYVSWAQTRKPTPTGTSRYKRGWDEDGKTYDKLSEFPFMALLFNGSGIGVEYNEPRGHAWMLEELADRIDKSRLAAGGACLSCKSPYAPQLAKEMGADYFRKPFDEVLARIPERHRRLGTACSDCHSEEEAALRLSHDFTLGTALRAIGKDPATLSLQELRSLVCAQCHATYSIPRDREGKAAGLFFPWQGGAWGRIPVESVIAQVRKNPEWVQSVTGFSLGLVRHPEFELYSTDSTHWKAGVACVDCHMPYQKAGAYKVSDHRVMSPLKNGLRGCTQCHPETPEWLRDRVHAAQDRTVSMLLRAGYATAAAAKLFEATHRAQKMGARIDPALNGSAKALYEEAFYRCVFIGAENSLGFHNPAESLRVLGDAAAFAGKAEGLLRQVLAQVGIQVPVQVDLELSKYLNDRGKRRLKFDPSQEFTAPFGTPSKP